MADPDTGVAVQGKVTANGRVVDGKADGSQETIVADIERTRENLARTIDSLAERVSPAGNVRRLREQAAEQLARPEVQLAAAAAGLAIVGVLIYKIWGTRRK
jgi:hypothetical protein